MPVTRSRFLTRGAEKGPKTVLLKWSGRKCRKWEAGSIQTEAGPVLKGIKINEPRFLGVVAKDDLACYVAVLQKIKTDVGSEKTQVALGANILARGKFITYNLYSWYVSGTTVTTMLAKHKINVEALVAANK